MKAASKITDLIGNTPLLELNRYKKEVGLEDVSLLGKLECFNPLSSAKDRVALALIEDAEKKGLIGEGATIIEPTSGNTGVGLAFVCATRGYKLILTMPDTMSLERRRLAAALGAELVLTEGALGMQGAVAKAEEIHRNTENSLIPGQFVNPANPTVHEFSTAEEIWRDTDGKIDIFVACIGTGGTITGVARGLKKKNPGVKIVGVEPASSPLLTKGKAGPHRIQGIGANFIPEILDTSLLNEVIDVENEEAENTAKLLARKEGVLVGISSGAAAFAAAKVAARPENKGKVIVALFPDTGERYLSTGIYD